MEGGAWVDKKRQERKANFGLADAKTPYKSLINGAASLLTTAPPSSLAACFQLSPEVLFFSLFPDLRKRATSPVYSLQKALAG